MIINISSFDEETTFINLDFKYGASSSKALTNLVYITTIQLTLNYRTKY